jgi:steroid delta-isomerase-like uncharacterized protein
MSAQQNKELIRRFFEVMNQEVWPKGNLSVTDDFISPDYEYHDPSSPVRGREGFRQLITMYRTAFPDARFTIEEQVAEGDKVLTRFSVTGTQRGTFLGIAPTNKKATVSVLSLVRLTGGKVVEEWERFDTLQLMQQLGAVPTLAHATR